MIERIISLFIVLCFIYNNSFLYALSSDTALHQQNFVQSLHELVLTIEANRFSASCVNEIVKSRLEQILEIAGVPKEDIKDSTITELVSLIPWDYIETHGNTTFFSYIYKLMKYADKADLEEYINKKDRSRRDLYGYIETTVLKETCSRLLKKYLEKRDLTVGDVGFEIEYWTALFRECISDKTVLVKSNHYLQQLLWRLRDSEENGVIIFTTNINHKIIRIIPKQKGQRQTRLYCERRSPLKFTVNSKLNGMARHRKTGHVEYNPDMHWDMINIAISQHHELFHIAWLNKLKTDRKAINRLVNKLTEEQRKKIKEALASFYRDKMWISASNQRVLNEVLANLWSVPAIGEDVDLSDFTNILPNGFLEEVERVLDLKNVSHIEMLDSSYVEEAIDMPCDDYYMAERNRRAEEERRKRERDEKERKRKEKEEKERLKKIRNKLREISGKMKDKVLNSQELINLYYENFEHDIRETILKRLGWLADRGKLNDTEFNVVNDLATALIEGVDEMGELQKGAGRFGEQDREILKQWLGEMGVDELITDVKESDTFKPMKKEDEDSVRNAIETEFHEQDVMDIMRELAPDVLGPQTLKIIFWIVLAIGIGYLFGWENTGIYLAMAIPITGGLDSDKQAKFPPGAKEKLKTPRDWISKYTINLNERAGETTANSIYLQKKMQKIDRVLRQPEHNNLVLAGDPQLTNELVENIASEIVRSKRENREERLDSSFKGAEILKFNVAAILGDLAQFGKYEKTMRDLVREIINAVKEDKKKYIFYFNFQDIAWINDQRIDMVADISMLFKTILEEPEVPVIGIASSKYYERFFMQAPANRDMQRYFSKIDLEELQIGDMQVLVNSYLKNAQKTYACMSIKMDIKDTLGRIMEIMQDYFKDYNIPVALLEMLDEIITEKIFESSNRELYREDLYSKIHKVAEELKNADKEGNIWLSGFLKDLLKQYIEKWRRTSETSSSEKLEQQVEITFNDLAEKISIRKNIPVTQLTRGKEERLDSLIPALKTRIVGQDFAIEEIHRKFKEKKRGISNKRLPFGAFAFLGPTGVGKTEVARALADNYFDGKMIRVDMSEYMEPHSKEKLFGSPGGYIGFEQGGVLTNAVRDTPFSLLLLDEIDKAHPEVFKILYQILDEGKCTDGQGREIDFSNTIIIMTGNVGMQNDENTALVRLLADIRCVKETGGTQEKIEQELKTQAAEAEKKIDGINWITNAILNRDLCDKSLDVVIEDIIRGLQDMINERLEADLKETFKDRAIMGRVRALGGIISFNGLTKFDLDKIVDIRLKEINEWLKPYKIKLSFSETVREKIIKEGYNPNMGARPLARAIRRLITSPLSDAILYDKINKNREVFAEINEEGRIIFKETGELTEEEKKIEDKKYPELVSILAFLSEDKSTDEDKLKAKLSEIFGFKPADIQKKGTALMDKDKLKIITPVDTQEIRKEAQGLSAENKRTVDNLIQEIMDQIKDMDKWVNDKFDSLTIKVKDKQLPRAFSKSETLTRLLDVLNQKRRCNPFLIGEDTRLRDSLIEYFTKAAYNGQLPGFENTRVLKLNVNEVIEYMPGIGMLEECMRKLLLKIEEDDKAKGLNTIVVIDYDELESTVVKYRRKRNDRKEEVFNLGFFMIPFIGSKVKVIMSTRNRRIKEFDIFNRYFSGVELQPMSAMEAKEAYWLYVKEGQEREVNGRDAKNIELDFQMLEKAIGLFQKYLPGEPLIETLLDFLKRIIPEKGDKTGTKEREISGLLDTLKNRLEFLRDTEGGAITLEILTKDETTIEIIRSIIQLKKSDKTYSFSITEEDIIDYLVNTRNVPIERIGVDEMDKLRTLETKLKEKIKGQDSQINRIAQAIKAGALGFKPKRHPLATFMFSGTTGCGKTETARMIAEALGYNFISQNLARFDKLEDLSTLTGPPPGYIGHGENVEQYLTTRVIKNPKSVIAFDEADKALDIDKIYGTIYEKRTLLDILLPIFEDGRLTDSIGQTADFSQCIVIIISNGGIKEVYDPLTFRFIDDDSIYQEIGELNRANKNDVGDKFINLVNKITGRIAIYLKKKMRPEMLNRIDENIVFNPLPRDQLITIMKRQINEFIGTIKKENNLEITYKDNAAEEKLILHILSSHFVPEEGARSLPEPIRKIFLSPIMDFIETLEKEKPRSEKHIKRKLIVDFNDNRLQLETMEEDSKQERIKLNEEERIILGNIVNGLKAKRQNEPMLEEELAEWFELRPLAKKDKSKPNPFVEETLAMTADTNDFWTMDKEKTLNIMSLRTQLSNILGINTELLDLLFDWLIAGINLARRMNLEQAMADKDIYQSGLGEDKPKLAGRIYEPLLEEADKKYKVTTLTMSKDDGIYIGIKFNTGLASTVYRLLFEKEWKDDTEIFNFCKANKLSALYPITLNILKLRAKGIQIEYSLLDNETILWLKAPVEKPPKEDTAPVIIKPAISELTLPSGCQIAEVYKIGNEIIYKMKKEIDKITMYAYFKFKNSRWEQLNENVIGTDGITNLEGWFTSLGNIVNIKGMYYYRATIYLFSEEMYEMYSRDVNRPGNLDEKDKANLSGLFIDDDRFYRDAIIGPLGPVGNIWTNRVIGEPFDINGEIVFLYQKEDEYFMYNGTDAQGQLVSKLEIPLAACTIENSYKIGREIILRVLDQARKKYSYFNIRGEKLNPNIKGPDEKTETGGWFDEIKEIIDIDGKCYYSAKIGGEWAVIGPSGVVGKDLIGLDGKIGSLGWFSSVGSLINIKGECNFIGTIDYKFLVVTPSAAFLYNWIVGKLHNIDDKLGFIYITGDGYFERISTNINEIGLPSQCTIVDTYKFGSEIILKIANTQGDLAFFSRTRGLLNKSIMGPSGKTETNGWFKDITEPKDINGKFYYCAQIDNKWAVIGTGGIVGNIWADEIKGLFEIDGGLVFIYVKNGKYYIYSSQSSESFSEVNKKREKVLRNLLNLMTNSLRSKKAEDKPVTEKQLKMMERLLAILRETDKLNDTLKLKVPLYVNDTDLCDREIVIQEREPLGYDVEGIAVDPETKEIYVATGTRQKIRILDAQNRIEDRMIDAKSPVHVCAVTKEYVFAGTDNGIYVYRKGDLKPFKTSIMRGQLILNRGEMITGLAVKEIDNEYEIVIGKRKKNKPNELSEISKFRVKKDGEVSQIKSIYFPVLENLGLTYTKDGKIALVYSSGICILNPDTLEIEGDIIESLPSDTLGPIKAVKEDENGFLCVTVNNSNKVLVIERTDEEVEKEYPNLTDLADKIKRRVKVIRKVDELIFPDELYPYGIDLRGDKLVVSFTGSGTDGSSIIAVSPRSDLKKQDETKGLLFTDTGLDMLYTVLMVDNITQTNNILDELETYDFTLLRQEPWFLEMLEEARDFQKDKSVKDRIQTIIDIKIKQLPKAEPGKEPIAENPELAKVKEIAGFLLKECDFYSLGGTFQGVNARGDAVLDPKQEQFKRFLIKLAENEGKNVYRVFNTLKTYLEKIQEAEILDEVRDIFRDLKKYEDDLFDLLELKAVDDDEEGEEEPSYTSIQKAVQALFTEIEIRALDRMFRLGEELRESGERNLDNIYRKLNEEFPDIDIDKVIPKLISLDPFARDDARMGMPNRIYFKERYGFESPRVQFFFPTRGNLRDPENMEGCGIFFNEERGVVRTYFQAKFMPGKYIEWEKIRDAMYTKSIDNLVIGKPFCERNGFKYDYVPGGKKKLGNIFWKIEAEVGIIRKISPTGEILESRNAAIIKEAGEGIKVVYEGEDAIKILYYNDEEGEQEEWDLQEGEETSEYFCEKTDEDIDPQIKWIIENHPDLYRFIEGETEELDKGSLEVSEKYEKLILGVRDLLSTEYPDLKKYKPVVMKGISFSGHNSIKRGGRIYIPYEILNIATRDEQRAAILKDFIKHEYLHSTGWEKSQIQKTDIYEKARVLYRKYVAEKLVELTGEEITGDLKIKLNRILMRVQQNKRIEFTETQIRTLLWLMEWRKDLNLSCEIASLVNLILDPDYTGNPADVVMAVEKEILLWLNGKRKTAGNYCDKEKSKLLEVKRTIRGISGVKGKIKKVMDFIYNYNIPQPAEIKEDYYVLIDEYRAERFRDVIKDVSDKWGVKFVTDKNDIPQGVNAVVLVDPEDIDLYQEFNLYLPMIYSRKSFELAAWLSITKDISRNSPIFLFMKRFYEDLLGEEIPDDELLSWFNKPDLLKNRITRILDDLKILRIAFSQIDTAA